MEYTKAEIIVAIIIMAIVIFTIFFLISLIPDHVIDPLDKKKCSREESKQDERGVN